MTAVDDFTLRHLAKIIDSSDDAIVSKNLDGIVQSWNAAAERMFGYSAAEIIGKSIRLIIPPDRQGEEDFVLGRVKAGQAIRHYETMRLRKDGQQLPVSLTVSPVHDETGAIIGASKIVRDISDRKAADLTARRLSAVIEWSDDAIVTKDLNSIITSWNRAAERMFGYTAEEVIGRSVRIIIPPELQNEEDMVLARIKAGQVTDHYETRRRRKDGTDVVVSLTVSPIVDNRGQIVGASKIARDVTERSTLRTRAEEQAAVTRRLSEAGAMVAKSLDQGTIVQRVTDIGTELTGAAFGAFFYRQIDGRSGDTSMLYTLAGTAKEMIDGSSRPRETPISVPAFDADAAIRVEDVTKDPRFAHNPPMRGLSNQHLPIRSYLAVPVTSGSGDVLGGLFFGHPEAGVFTAQHEQLAVGVSAWASVALENARLYREARDADRLKDEFLAVLSHELRTPLNAIVGYARLLRGGVLVGEKASAGLETLERNATALTRIVEDVLDVSRIVTGKIRLDVQPVELGLIVHNAVATVKPAADAKEQRIQTIVDPRVGAVSGDPDRLQQVVWNLLSNAVKFTPKGGRVQVRVEAVNSHVEIVVSDSGAGIAPDFLPFVFDRFRQADAGTNRRTGGLGLGLSIVRHIVEMHGGSVHVASDGPDQGTTFRLKLPLMIVHQEGAREARQHPRSEKPRPLARLGDLRGLRVLAIDDEADALGLLRNVLEASGATVVTMNSAREALEHIETIAPDVVVTDLGMPDMDGFDFITQLRASPGRSRNTPAAALTAFARSEDRTRALQTGFEMHLAKPVDPGELVASVARLVRRRS